MGLVILYTQSKNVKTMQASKMYKYFFLHAEAMFGFSGNPFNVNEDAALQAAVRITNNVILTFPFTVRVIDQAGGSATGTEE